MTSNKDKGKDKVKPEEEQEELLVPPPITQKRVEEIKKDKFDLLEQRLTGLKRKAPTNTDTGSSSSECSSPLKQPKITSTTTLQDFINIRRQEMVELFKKRAPKLAKIAEDMAKMEAAEFISVIVSALYPYYEKNELPSRLNALMVTFEVKYEDTGETEKKRQRNLKLFIKYLEVFCQLVPLLRNLEEKK
jgi:hypothetical protein